MKLLLVRNHYPRSLEANFCLNSLLLLPGVEVTQFCPVAVPRAHYEEGDPVFSPHQAAPQLCDPREARRQIARGRFDLIILTAFSNWRVGPALEWARWGRKAPLRWIARAARKIERSRQAFLEDCFADTPTVALDMGDPWTVEEPELPWLTSGRLFFKREIPFDRTRLFPTRGLPPAESLAIAQRNLRHVPLGLDDKRFADLAKHRVPENARDIDVFWAGGENNTLRTSAVAHLRALAATTSWRVVIAESKLSFPEYCGIAARSKITLSVAGRGWDCYRHSEAVALGSVPFMNQPSVDTPVWQELPQALFFENTFRDFGPKLRALVGSPQLRGELSAACEQRVRERCLWSAAMAHLLHETRARHPQLPAV